MTDNVNYQYESRHQRWERGGWFFGTQWEPWPEASHAPGITSLLDGEWDTVTLERGSLRMEYRRA
jgi:hypothetical protein